MGIPSKDGNGTAFTFASTPTPEGELPSSTQADPGTGLPFKGASETTLEAARLLLAALLDRAPASVGKKPAAGSSAVALSDEDADMLAQIVERLGVLQLARNADGSLRVTLLGGTVAAVTTVGTVTTVTTVTTVATLSNQTNVGGYSAAPEVPALMNLAAASNIDRMVG